MRWRCVGRATGLIQNEKDMKSNCDIFICTLYDELFFEENSVPDVFNTRYGCGSVCVLLRIVFMAYKNKFGEFQIMDLNENTFESFEGVPLEDLHDGLCENGYIFLYDHQLRLITLLSKLLLFENDDIAFELMNWLLGRNRAGYRFPDLSGKVSNKLHHFPKRLNLLTPNMES